MSGYPRTSGPQGCIDLQSPVKCLDQVETVCSHARLWQAALCIEMRLGDYCYRQVKPLTSIAAEKPT